MTSPPTIAVLSADSTLAPLVSAIGDHSWRIERASPLHNDFRVLSTPQLRLVILDDEGIEPGIQTWILAQIHKRAPDAAILYVAASHDTVTERQARTNGAQYYCAKPIDRTQFASVLNSFLKAAK
jgi:response regulator of citrate/malate metabolism